MRSYKAFITASIVVFIVLLAIEGLLLSWFISPNYIETKCNVWNINGPFISDKYNCPTELTFYYSYPNSSQGCVQFADYCGSHDDMKSQLRQVKAHGKSSEGYYQVPCYYQESMFQSTDEPCKTHVKRDVSWIILPVIVVHSIVIIYFLIKVKKYNPEFYNQPRYQHTDMGYKMISLV